MMNPDIKKAGFCGYMQQHGGLWKISILTFLVVDIVKNNYAGRGMCIELLHYQIMQRQSPQLICLNEGNFKYSLKNSTL